MITIVVPEWVVWCLIVWGGLYVLDVLMKIVGIYLKWSIEKEKKKFAQHVARKFIKTAEEKVGEEVGKILREGDGAPKEKRDLN